MPYFDWRSFIEKFRWQIAIFLLGLVILGAGLILSNDSLTRKNDVVILESATESQQTKELVVEIAGSIQKPGVYKLPAGARVEDLLILAGGVSENADRVWMEKFLNRASKLSDGQKVFIPSSDTDNQSNVLSANAMTEEFGGNPQIININDSTLSELDSLPGIGPVYGQKIIENRPYSDTSELLSKKIIPAKTYEKIKDNISVY